MKMQTKHTGLTYNSQFRKYTTCYSVLFLNRKMWQQFVLWLLFAWHSIGYGTAYRTFSAKQTNVGPFTLDWRERQLTSDLTWLQKYPHVKLTSAWRKPTSTDQRWSLSGLPVGYPPSGRIVRLRSDTDIQKLLSNGNWIRIRISETLFSLFRGFRLLGRVAHSTIVYLVSSTASFQPSMSFLQICLWHCDVLSLLYCSPMPYWLGIPYVRVAWSTFCQGAKSSPEIAKKEPNSKKWGQKKGQPIFPNLLAVTKSYELILSNFVNGSFPQSQL